MYIVLLRIPLESDKIVAGTTDKDKAEQFIAEKHRTLRDEGVRYWEQEYILKEIEEI